MGRARDPRRDEAFVLYEKSSGKALLKDIAETLDVPEGTIRGWKRKDKWEQKLNGAFQKIRNAPKIGAPLKNKNAEGCGAPERNQNAVTHGLFARYLPAETLDIVQHAEMVSPIDLLWNNIMIQYGAIIRAQKIMYVCDQEDLTEVLKREKEGCSQSGSSWEKEYELQFAWDKQANFLQAQSRAMGTLNNMLRQYDKLCKSDLATEEQRLRVEKLKAEINKLDGQNSDEKVEIVIKRKAKSHDSG